MVSAGTPPPKVSVCVVTYNHGRYIRQCLQSLVDQVTDFGFEILVGDDCSSDETREIVREFSARYPGVVKPLLHRENVGPYRNFALVQAGALGEYIAHMDGDDYALPGKLQKQADFLDRHRSCSFVCHRVLLVDDSGQTLGMLPEGPRPPLVGIDELVKNYLFFTHSSKMHRRRLDVFNHSDKDCLIDFYVHVEHASMGPIGFLPDLLGGYRKHAGGITSSGRERQYWLVDLTVDGFDRARQLGVREEIVNYGKAKFLLARAMSCFSHGDMVGFKRHLHASRIKGRYFSFAHAVVFRLGDRPRLLRALLKVKRRMAGLNRRPLWRPACR
jgi:glycosyltransferase involved in cell wall biosynthesis